MIGRTAQATVSRSRPPVRVAVKATTDDGRRWVAVGTYRGNVAGECNMKSRPLPFADAMQAARRLGSADNPSIVIERESARVRP